MSLPKLVTCFPITNQQTERLQREASGRYEVVVAEQETIADDLMQASIFFGHAKVPVDWEAVIAAGNLKWIQSSAAGLDHCLTPEVIASDVPVSGCSGLFAPQVAEQAMALLMGLLRRLPIFFHAQQKREFIRRPTDNLEDKRVLIVGLGGNGQRIARTLRPMTEQLIGTDCFPGAVSGLVEDGILQQVFAAEELDRLLPEADVIVVTLPLSESNEQLLGQRQFEIMKPGVYLINVGRGSVVETQALAQSLQRGHLGGAGIDVVDPEPLPEDSPLWEIDNLIITPHVGAQSPRRVPVTIELFCENLKRFEAGQPLLNWVDKQLGFPRPKHRIDF